MYVLKNVNMFPSEIHKQLLHTSVCVRALYTDGDDDDQSSRGGCTRANANSHLTDS